MFVRAELSEVDRRHPKGWTSVWSAPDPGDAMS
jgi:hypothetical protein